VNFGREIKLKKPAKQRGRLNVELYWKIYDALTPLGQCFPELMYLTRQRPTEIRLLRESQIGPERIPSSFRLGISRGKDKPRLPTS
jgi:hypothetical protein